MDVKAYIESGIIELYILGLASPEEQAELEALRMQYPAINQAILQVEMELEAAAQKNAITPPPNSKIRFQTFLSQQAQPLQAPVKHINKWQLLAAASVLLFIISSGLNFYFYNQANTINSKYQALLSEHATLAANHQTIQTKLESLNQSLAVLSDPNFKAVAMSSASAENPNLLATVYWNQKTAEVYLLTNNLPEVTQEQQYQLWAIVDGTPVSIGLVDDCSGLCKMSKITSAQAFAISLEKRGGSSKPNAPEGAIYVVGKI